MICYRDMTFCEGDGCTKFDSCPRALTEEVWMKAANAELQVSRFANPRSLQCWSGELSASAPQREEERSGS